MYYLCSVRAGGGRGRFLVQSSMEKSVQRGLSEEVADFRLGLARRDPVQEADLYLGGAKSVTSAGSREVHLSGR